jgi:hypothetical protein
MRIPAQESQAAHSARRRIAEGIMDSAVQGWLDRLPKVIWTQRQCPLCSSIHFEQAESGPLDNLLGLFMLRPIRCVNCWRRYYWLARAGGVVG